jgi:hypothetical protein
VAAAAVGALGTAMANNPKVQALVHSWQPSAGKASNVLVRIHITTLSPCLNVGACVELKREPAVMCQGDGLGERVRNTGTPRANSEGTSFQAREQDAEVVYW